ncbi:SDR family oxidoreductase [Ktedonosporobacter rubrisoli]|uniref:SDR family oxidoreductase n=1 Tax=Ktedonosporobacter rubrisoli TaxID=2509675 RepID=A0A4P6JIT9_KTERU|nr:SDR family oxidoreductase [Ktedonosporobacter rubrisoli]QBD74989.1 SDR family oxidoreductase [Ktedonosporobacter rubrisoli]
MAIGEQANLNLSQPMKDRIALVTGGSRGIGAATATLLGRYGAMVAVNYYRNEAAAQQVVAAIKEAGGQALAVQADVANAEQVESMVQTVSKAFGLIDTLILNAPAAGSPAPDSTTLSAGEYLQAILAPFTGSRWEVLEAFVTGQLQSAYYLSQAIVPGMIKQHKGSIVFVSSTTARQPVAGGGGLTISVAKASVESLIKNMAEELGPHGIRVNAVSAGHIVTDLNAGTPQEVREQMAQATALRRNGRPEDVASPIVYLASDQAAFITGAYLTVDGGKLLL